MDDNAKYAQKNVAGILLIYLILNIEKYLKT